MANSSVSNLGNAASPKPSVDAWCVFELNSGSNPTVVDSVGVSSVTRISTGAYRVNFSDPSKFSSGGYLAMVQPEAGNDPTGYWTCVSHGTTLNSASTATGASASHDIVAHGFDSTSFTIPNTLSDFSNTKKARVNVAFVSLRNTSDLFTPKNENLVAYSENLNSWHYKGNIAVSSTTISPPNELPIGVTVWKLAPSSGIAVGNAAIGEYTASTAPSLEPGAFYTISAYVKAGDITSPAVILQLRDINTQTHSITFSYAFAGSGTVNTAGTSWSNTKSSVVALNDGWYRISTTGKWNGTGSIVQVYVFSGSNSGANADGVKGNYATAIQVEKGTFATPYVKTEATVPVLGNQDSLINLYPSTRGFGVSGSTYSSAITQLNNKRAATAWGTIVIPPVGGVTAYPYLEGAYNVSTVVPKGKAVFDLYFTTEMGNTGYCVVTSTEQETVYDETAAVGTAGSIPTTYEYSLNLLRNQNTLDDQRRTNGFSVSSLRQVGSAPVKVVAINGVTQSERLDLWTKNSWMNTVSANTGITSPNEIYGITAWKLAPISGACASSSAITGACTGIVTTQNSTYTMSAYVRGGDLPSPAFYNYFRVGSTEYAQNRFVLETNTMDAGVAAGNWSGLTYGMRALENGWYRIHTTATWTGSSGLTVGVWLFAGTTAGGNSDGTKGVHATAIQFEENAKPSQYTATTTSAPVTFGTRVVGGNTSVTNNPFQTTDTSFRGLYTYTPPEGLASVFWLTWYSRITTGSNWYNLKVDRIRGGSTTNLYSGLYSGFYDDRYDHTTIGTVHEFHPMRVSITGHQNGDIYQVSGVASQNNTTAVSGLTAQQLEIKDFYRVNKNSNFSETYSIYPFQITDTQRIHFLVFGGLTGYGAS